VKNYSVYFAATLTAVFTATAAIANPVAPTTAKQIPAKTAQSVSEIPNGQMLLDKLQKLEQKQQQLEQEISTLRSQLSNRPAPSKDPVAVTVIENRPPQFEVSAQALFIQPSTGNFMDFAILDSGTALATSGEIAQLDYKNVTATRLGITYRPENTAWELGATHTWFQSDSNRSVVRDQNGALFSTFTHPFQNDSADTASARANLSYRSTAVDLGYRLQVGKSLGLRIFGGLQYSDVKQDMNVAYDGRDFNKATTETANRFQGVGPRFGAEAKVMIAKDLSLFGQGAGALLVGNRETSYRETDNDGADVVASVAQDRKNQFVPVVDLSLGLSWQPTLWKQTKLNLATGYEYQHWFNLSESIRFADSSSPGAFTQTQNSLSLRGFFLKLGISSEF
jgi:Legionella pneumophila major outer membrane protein precursor